MGMVYKVKGLIFFLGWIGVFAHLPAQNGLDLDGVNDYVQTTCPGVSGSGARTVEAWIKTTANADPNNGGVQQIIADYGTFVNGARFTFNVLWANAIRLEVGGNGLSGTIAVNDGNWHHVAAVWDPTATNKVSLYVDGVLDAAGNLTVATNTGTGNALMLGRRIDGARMFDGIIDEVRFWNVAKTQGQIAAGRNQEICTAPTPNLIAYYNFNQGVAGGTNTGLTTQPDYSGNNYTATLNNFTLSGSSSNWVQGANVAQGITYNNVSHTDCDSYFWAGDSTTRTSSGVFTAQLQSLAGCDSNVTLNLTILQSSSSADTAEACYGYLWPVDSITYNTSGQYTATLTNMAGCDSTVTLNLTIHDADSTTETITACESYLWPTDGNTYTATGNYSANFPNQYGCDSTIHLALTIETVDTSVDGSTPAQLTANQAGATYQWVDCSNGYAPISGATGQVFQPAQNGVYALVVSRGTCTDTSGCHTVIVVGTPDRIPSGWRVYPNPTSGQFWIESETMPQAVQVIVSDALGREVQRQTIDQEMRFQMDLRSAPRGMFFVILQSPTGNPVSFPILIEK